MPILLSFNVLHWTNKTFSRILHVNGSGVVTLPSCFIAWHEQPEYVMGVVEKAVDYKFQVN